MEIFQHMFMLWWPSGYSGSVLEGKGSNPGGCMLTLHFTWVNEIVRLNDGNILVLTYLQRKYPGQWQE